MVWGSPQRNEFSLYEVQIDNVPQVITEVENKLLIDIFIEKEVRDALFQMKHNKSLCPGFL